MNFRNFCLPTSLWGPPVHVLSIVFFLQTIFRDFRLPTTFWNFRLPTTLQRPPAHVLSVFFTSDALPWFPPTDVRTKFPPTEVLTTTSCPQSSDFFFLPTTFRHFRLPTTLQDFYLPTSLRRTPVHVLPLFFFCRKPSEISAYRCFSENSAYRWPCDGLHYFPYRRQSDKLI